MMLLSTGSRLLCSFFATKKEMCLTCFVNSITLFYVVYYHGNITAKKIIVYRLVLVPFLGSLSLAAEEGGGDGRVKKRALNITTSVVLQAFSGICGVVCGVEI
jgi:hypothetical protein